MNRFFILLLFCVSSLGIQAQESQAAQLLFELINEARTQPKQFLTRYRTETKHSNAKFDRLASNEAIEAIKWDKGLEKMAKTRVETGHSNPIYKGKNTICSVSGGFQSGSPFKEREKYDYLQSFLSNMLDADNIYVGFYFNKQTTKFAFYFGGTCQPKKIKYTFEETIDSSMVDFDRLNTAKEVDYMTEMEKRMLLEINFVRAYPKVYAKIIQQQLAARSQSIWGLKYSEYVAAIELIEELNRAEPKRILQPLSCLQEAARLHGLYCQERGYSAHDGRNRSSPQERISAQCKKSKRGNENLAAVRGEFPRRAVINLLIDDGIDSRGHRYNMLRTYWKYGACFAYKDKKYGRQWVQNFSN